MITSSVADRLIVALDVERSRLRPLVDRLSSVRTFKVGMEAFYREGAALVEWLGERGHPVFLDLKLHDIPNQVERAARVVAELGVRFLTVHASGGPAMLAAAVRGAAAVSPDLKILGVTVLTSLQGDELPSVWDPATSVEAKVLALAGMARDAGCHGVIASPRETAALRRRLGSEMLIVTPGVRPAAAETGDQRRTAAPRDAIAAGADHLVVGRPITAAPDPAAAAAAVMSEIASGLGSTA